MIVTLLGSIVMRILLLQFLHLNFALHGEICRLPLGSSTSESIVGWARQANRQGLAEGASSEVFLGENNGWFSLGNR